MTPDARGARLAIFDCDGTLVDSGADIVAAMDRAFGEEGLPPPAPETTRRIVGLSLPQAIAILASDRDAATRARLTKGYNAAFQAMRAAGDVAEPLYDGIASVVETLDETGWQLAVATGKSDRGLRLCLERHGLHARFRSLQTADRHPSKPHPAMIHAALADAGVAPAGAAMIGDTSYDMAMAREAGVFAIGVAWGYHDHGELVAAGAQAVARTPAGLLTILEATPWN